MTRRRAALAIESLRWIFLGVTLLVVLRRFESH